MTANCKICDDSGYLRGEDLEWFHPDFGKLVPCDCRKEESRKDKEESQIEMDFSKGENDER